MARIDAGRFDAARVGPRRITDAWGQWFGAIFVLMVRNLGFRYRRSRLGSALAILEPIGVVAMLSFTHSAVNGPPPFGGSPTLFFGTGTLCFYLFFHTSWRLRLIDVLKPLPRTTKFDMVVSHVLDEIITKIIIMIVCFGPLWVLGLDEAMPARPLLCLVAMLEITMLGVGVGLLNAIISGFFFSWMYIYAIVMRAWMVLSGVLWVVDWMPKNIRDVVVYNPLAHAVTWFRFGYYENYPTVTLDVPYMLVFTAVVLVSGVVLMMLTDEWRGVGASH